MGFRPGALGESSARAPAAMRGTVEHTSPPVPATHARHVTWCGWGPTVKHFDVVVAGGSVAGCAMGVELASRGLHVAVLEREEFPREKPCGEGLMPSGTAVLRRWGVLDAVMAQGAQTTRGVVLHLAGKTASGAFPEGETGIAVRRSRLDATLARHAVGCGVERLEGSELTGLQRTAAGWTVETSQGPLQARFFVGADGSHGPSRRLLDLHQRAPGEPRFGLRQHFRLRHALQESMVHIHFRPGWDVYITHVAPGECNVAVLCSRESIHAFKQGMADSLATQLGNVPEVAALLDGAEPITSVRAWGPLRTQARDCVTEGALLVGDAAGSSDAITGQGMSIALTTAVPAAEAIAQSLAHPKTEDAALARYRAARLKRTRDMTMLTSALLWSVEQRWTQWPMMRVLEARPELLARCLQVNDGVRRLPSVAVQSLPDMVWGLAAPR